MLRYFKWLRLLSSTMFSSAVKIFRSKIDLAHFSPLPPTPIFLLKSFFHSFATFVFWGYFEEWIVTHWARRQDVPDEKGGESGKKRGCESGKKGKKRCQPGKKRICEPGKKKNVNRAKRGCGGEVRLLCSRHLLYCL